MKNLFAAMAVLFLVGCAAKPEFSAVRSSALSKPVTHVYLYSFLKMREDTIGKSLTRKLSMFFEPAFKKHDVDLSQKWFTLQDSVPGHSMMDGNDGMAVPVKAYIAGHMDKEVQSGADYRLVVFPSYVSYGNGKCRLSYFLGVV